MLAALLFPAQTGVHASATRNGVTMTRDECTDDFTALLWAQMRTVTGTTAGLVFGGYIVGFASPRGDERAITVVAQENTPGGLTGAVDAMKWSASLDDDPMPTVDAVAQWLRPRTR